MTCYLRLLGLALLAVAIVGSSQVYAVELGSDNWNLNFFSYVSGRAASSEDLDGDDITLGETSIFVVGRLSDRLSVLTEVTALPKKYRQDTIKVERLSLRFELSEKHSLHLGKMHTPVNYWNDTFHHGRYFFPTIDRPLVFKNFIPIHDIGLRFSGNRLGKYGFFYDVVLGSGKSAGNKAFANGLKSLTVALGMRPIENLEIRTSIYRDTLLDHASQPGHSGSTNLRNTDLRYSFWSGSIHYENSTMTALGEVSSGSTDSAGSNHAAYLFFGWKWRSQIMPFLFADNLSVDAQDEHFRTGTQRRFGVGLQYMISERSDLKIEIATNRSNRDSNDPDHAYLRFQLSVGI